MLAFSASCAQLTAHLPSNSIFFELLPSENTVDHDHPLEHASKLEQIHGAKSTSHIAAQSADAAVDVHAVNSSDV